MVPFTPKAILFDLDGTLLDTLADLTAGVNGMLTELGQPTRSEQEVRRFVGRGFARLVECSLTEGRPEYILDEQGLEHASALFRRQPRISECLFLCSFLLWCGHIFIM